MTHPLSAYPQFINWTYVQRPGKPKPDKVPCNAAGVAIDPHDPANWMTHTDAVATGRSIGFVLTDADPFFLLDLDGQRDPITGTWTDLATHVGRVFSGAAMEVSDSGTGMHVIASCEQNRVETLRNKWHDGALEFYHRKRFIALSQFGLSGDVTVDCTDRLLEFVPQREAPVGGGASLPGTGPDAAYTGPEDDETLLSMMLSARGSTNQAFGGSASFRVLWDADDAELSRFFPSETDGYDKSRADAALLSQLAFWTGRDWQRMERLWRRSALGQKQPKIDRPDYVSRSISGAVGITARVYDKPRPSAAKSGAAPAAGAPTGDGAGGEYLTVMDQIEHFSGCVYVEEDHAVMAPDGDMLKPEVFRVRYGGAEFQMQADGARPTRDAFEAFTQNRAHRFPRARRKCFRPNHPFGLLDTGEVNTYRPHVPVVSDAPVDRYLDLLSKILPNERDRTIFLSWCAAMVQNPGAKFQWAVVLQGTEGNGKTFLLKCLEHAVGRHLTHLPNPEDMNEKFNTYIEGKLLIGVEEIHMEGRRDLLDRLKKYITNDRIEIRGMRADKRMADNVTNWMFLTNYQNAVIKSRNDRRYAIFFAAQQSAADLHRDGMTGVYFPDLWTWAREGGFDAVTGFLGRYEIPDELNPAGHAHRAPETSSTHQAVRRSYGPIEQELIEAVEQEVQGFRHGWISTYKAREWLSKRGVRFSNGVLSDAIQNIGYETCKLWRDGRAPVILEEGNIRPTIYCTPEKNQNIENIQNYLEDQGYNLPKFDNNRVVPIR